MSLIERIEKRQREDAERERKLNLRKNDPLAEKFGGTRYSPDDIEAREYARIGAAWSELRRRQWQKETPS